MHQLSCAFMKHTTHLCKIPDLCLVLFIIHAKAKYLQILVIFLFFLFTSDFYFLIIITIDKNVWLHLPEGKLPAPFLLLGHCRDQIDCERDLLGAFCVLSAWYLKSPGAKSPQHQNLSIWDKTTVLSEKPYVPSSGSRGALVARAPIAPMISSKSCSFQAILRETPLFWTNFRLWAPLGVNTQLPPWPKSWIRSWCWCWSRFEMFRWRRFFSNLFLWSCRCMVVCSLSDSHCVENVRDPWLFMFNVFVRKISEKWQNGEIRNWKKKKFSFFPSKTCIVHKFWHFCNHL